MHDRAVVHRAVRHGVGVVGRAHDAVEVALHDAHAARVIVTALHHEDRRRRDDRDAGPEREPLQAHGNDDGEREERNAELEVSRQRERRDDRHQHGAQRATERDHQIEARKPRRIWLRARELAMAEHAGDEEAGEIERRGDAQLQGRDVVGHRRHENEERPGEERAPIPARMVEGEDESDEVDGKRQHPEKGHARDVLRDVIGDRKQHHRAHGGEREPQELA